MAMNYNTDLIETVDTVYVETYKEAKTYIQENSYVCPPVEIVDDEEREKFGRHYKIVDRYQSGNVQYASRHS